ncbi:hypothetical protein C6Z68_003695 [Salmonella enterica subsp. enterica serovar 4,[5],12:i:-]|nr:MULTISPECIES: hypothetical protein [Gammaproteobacteria]AUR79847.1 hypothetical protein pCf587_0065 [Citrobacter freundii]EDQ3718143.1 hypothetical protein [Salmonella enterica subsp. enterica serovar 4,[5],12:i:-]EKV8809966.1 hypothetical protein [Klebsiella aerogenes]ELZ0961998.1 hypothetical protein [Salmonella enterica subsp. enterica serovar Uganda]EMB1873331.1 hypothetical protein [Escherichia coli]WGN22740.1 hypothetical protein B0D47_23450 [Salmonella enterica subsp. enterica serov
MDPLKPKQSEPEWAEMLNKNMGDKQQRKETFWRNAVIFFVLLGIVLHFFGK